MAGSLLLGSAALGTVEMADPKMMTARAMYVVSVYTFPCRRNSTEQMTDATAILDPRYSIPRGGGDAQQRGNSTCRAQRCRGGGR